MKTYKQFLEDIGVAPTTNVGSGHIAGTSEPPVSPKAQKKYTAKNSSNAILTQTIKRTKPKM